MKKLFKFFFLTAIIFSGIFTHAQVRDTDLVLDISPLYPNPNENVTATLTSYATNLDKAVITWSVDGQVRSEGIGKKSFFFTMAGAGTTLNISATINTLDGQSLQKSVLVTPTAVDLLWEANDSYSPPFYKGKTLVGSQGEFKVVAIPSLRNQNGAIDPDNLSYTWSKDGDMQPDSSGWGKTSFVFTNSYLDKGNSINLKVSDITGKVNASSNMDLQTSTPKVLFYEKDPALGVKWERSLNDGFIVNPSGSILVAEPYFFSPKDISTNDLTFTWYLNDGYVDTPTPKNVLSVKPEAGKSGNSIIRVVVNNVRTLFQTAEKTLNVTF